MVQFREWLSRSALTLGAAAFVLTIQIDGADARRSNDKYSGGNAGSSGSSGSSSGGASKASGGSSSKSTDKPTRSTSDKPSRTKPSKSSSNGEANGKQARIYNPPKPPPKDPPKNWPPKYPPKQTDGGDKPPKYPPKPPRNRPPVIVLPLPPSIPVPPVVTVVTPSPSGGSSFVPPSPPQARVIPPRRLPMVVPPLATLNRSRDREIIVAVDDAVSDGDAIVFGQRFQLNAEVQYRSSLLGLKIVRLRIPDNRSRASVIRRVMQANDQRVIAVQPNYVFQTSQGAVAAAIAPMPQYAPDKLRIGEAHRVSMGRDVRVAVIDTGLDADHPELAGAIAESYDAIGEGPVDVEAHGTAIAGIVASRRQIQGVAPDARVLAVRAFSTVGKSRSEATTLSLIKGLDWAASRSARVVNMSFAGPKDPLLKEAINRAEAKGMIMVAAAGNGGPKADQAYPAAYDRVIAVTASDSDDKLYTKANRGSYIAVAAPGVDILTPAPQASYEMSSGTSLAAAHVSGIIALMLERRPTLSTEAIRSILSSTARDPGSALKRGFGAGIVDAARAVAESK